MPANISFRDVTFSGQVSTVTITVTTDVPCHLWCRLTLEKPRIHTKTVERRGVTFNSELYFCFVAYEDNEQIEPGDTLIHSWVKPAWGYCVTKYVYFWGYVGGVVSPSTSPFFSYHNKFSLVIPTMYQRVLEPWTYYTPPPPAMLFILLEPWSFFTPPTPAMHQLILEPWGQPAPAMHQLILEPWTDWTPPAPAMHQLILEPWTS